jgi:hypothetical protein
MLQDVQAQNRLAREIEQGERVLWSGRPDNRRWLCSQDVVLLPFSIVWCAIVFASSAGALSSHGGESAFSILSNVPFVLIGLYLLVGRLFVRRRIRGRTLYAVTETRALSIEGTWRGAERVRSVWFGAYPPVDEQLGRDGSGTIVVGSLATGRRRLGAGSGWPAGRSGTANAVVFADIADAADVYATIRHQLSDSGTVRASS